MTRPIQPRSPLRFLLQGVGLLGTRLLGLIMGMGVVLLMARALGAADFGTFSLGLVLAQAATSLADYGLNPLLTRDSAIRPEHERALLRHVVVSKMTLNSVLAVCLALCGAVLQPDWTGRIAIVLILVTLPVLGLASGAPLLALHNRFRAVSLLALLQSSVWLAVVAVLFLFDGGLMAFAVGYAIATSIYAVATYVTTHRPATIAQLPVPFRSLSRLFGEAARLAGIGLLTTLYVKLDYLIVYEISGAAPAGTYALAYRFLEQASVIPLTLSTLFFPLIARAQGDPDRLRSAFSTCMSTTFLLCTPISAIAMLVSPPLVAFVFGDEFAGSTHVLPILLPAFLFISLGYVLGQMTVVTRRTATQLKIAALALVVNVGLNFAFVPAFGPTAAATITVTTEVLVAALMYLSLRRYDLRVDRTWFLRYLAATAASAAVAVPLALQGWHLAGAAAFAIVFAAAMQRLRLLDMSGLQLMLAERAPQTSAATPASRS